jgi:hypothetical protein
MQQDGPQLPFDRVALIIPFLCSSDRYQVRGTAFRESFPGTYFTQSTVFSIATRFVQLDARVGKTWQAIELINDFYIDLETLRGLHSCDHSSHRRFTHIISNSRLHMI